MVRLFLILTTAWVVGLLCFINPAPPSLELTDAIVVLTGGSGRIEEGLQALKKRLAPKLFISGVHEDVTYEALSLDQSLSQKVFLGHQATTTRENALETRDWLQGHQVHSIRLVTAHYHIQRSLLEYRHVLPTLKIVPHPFVPAAFKDGWWHTKKTVKLVIHEYNKFLMTYLRIMIEGRL